MSWCIQLLIGGGLVASAYLLGSEGGYELLPRDNNIPATEERVH